MKRTADHDCERRMNNWRLWRVSGGGSLGGSPYPAYNLAPRPPRGENIMPILVGEAEETDQVVCALRPDLRRVVEVWYLRGGTINQKRKMLRCRRERMMELLDEALVKILERLAKTRNQRMERAEDS